MDMFVSSGFWVTLGQIIMINIVLSGDNAVSLRWRAGCSQGDAYLAHEAAPVFGMLLVVGAGRWLATRKTAGKERSTDVVSTPLTDSDAGATEAAPPGYHWVPRCWRTLPDGTRDYAAYHGEEAFRVLVPVSSHLRTHTLTALLAAAEPGQHAEPAEGESRGSRLH